MYINGLLCFLTSTYKYDMNQFFTVSHQQEARYSTWDIEKGGMVTQHDRELQLEDLDKAYIFTNISLVKETSENLAASSNIPRREDGSYLDSQVSTVRSQEQKQIASSIATLQDQISELKRKSNKSQAHIKKLIKAQEPLKSSSASKDSTLESIDKNDSAQNSSLSSGSNDETVSTLQTIKKGTIDSTDDHSISSLASGDTTSAGNQK